MTCENCQQMAGRLAAAKQERDDLSNRLADALSWQAEAERLRKRIARIEALAEYPPATLTDHDGNESGWIPATNLRAALASGQAGTGAQDEAGEGRG